MKKISYLAMALVAIMSAFTFAACSSDDNNENGGATTYGTTCSFVYNVSKDLLSVADITVSYSGADGVTKSEAMSDTTWTKDLSSTKLGVEYNFTVNMKMKEGITLDKDKYVISRYPIYEVCSFVNGKLADECPAFISYNRMSLAADDVAAYVTKHATTSWTFAIDSEGKITVK